MYDFEDDFELEENEYKNERDKSFRRKNTWKHAAKRKRILDNEDLEMKKPFHFYNKNFPNFSKIENKPSERDKKQINNFKEQLKEVYTGE